MCNFNKWSRSCVVVRDLLLSRTENLERPGLANVRLATKFSQLRTLFSRYILLLLAYIWDWDNFKCDQTHLQNVLS